jgi:N-methylhydantoinase A
MSVEMIGVDVGGTFTDVVGVLGGQIHVAKVPTDTISSDTSVIAGALQLGVADAAVFNLASTAGLNALITRRVPKVAFLTTFGHRDILDRGSLGRPLEALTDMSWRRGIGDASRPLVPRYLRRGIRERIRGNGEVLVPLDEHQTRQELAVLAACGVEGVAICLLNAYLNGEHEQRLRALVDEVLAVPCSVSSEVSPLAKEFSRASTTVIDLIMKMKYSDYTSRLDSALRGNGFDGQFNYADCSARLLPSDYAMERPHRLVVGGPAGGAASSAHFGSFIDERNIIGIDVGGTSCDISVVIDGEPWANATFELEHDLVVNALATDIVTLGAGGGSIVWINDTGEVQVGPDSAGANPGPACYGHGGERPTLTDAALLMGILGEGTFLGGRMRLDRSLAEQAFNSLDTPLSLSQRIDYAWHMGLNNMAEGIVNIAVRRGIDVREFSVMAFGAAGPMLVPDLLDLVPARRVIVPPHPGLFSALGLVSSDQVYSDHRSAYMLLTPDAAPRLDELFRKLESGLAARAGVPVEEAHIIRTFDGRLLGQTWETSFVDVPNGPITPEVVEDMVARFHDTYERRNGNRFPALPVQGVTYLVRLVVPTTKVQYQRTEPGGWRTPRPSGSVTLQHVRGGAGDGASPEYERGSLRNGHTVVGPAVVREEMSTTYVPPGRRLTVGPFGELIIE